MNQPDRSHRAPTAAAPLRRPLATAVLLGLASMPAARAASIVVTSPGDTSANATTTCTLRQAVLSMNDSTLSGNCANTGAAFGSSDTITFAAGIGTITLADAPNNELRITRSQLVIDAGAGRTVTVERPAAATNAFSLISAEGQSLSLTGLVLKNGRANRDVEAGGPKYPVTLKAGGAIHAESDLSLDRCSIVGSRADIGAGISVSGNNHKLKIQSSEISGNNASYSGGAILIRNGWLTLLDSTVSGNQGGALLGYSSRLYLRNATVSGNQAVQGGVSNKYGDGNGSAISVANIGKLPLTIVSSTIACNTGSAAAIDSFNGVTTLTNTVLANLTNQACTTSTTDDIAVPGSASNTLQVHGDHNLVMHAAADVTFDTPPLVGDPRLQTLANNGGLTRTHALSPGSTVIDRGANPTGIAYDQRGAGYTRESGAAADIGAYEVQNPTYCGSANRQPFSSLTAASANLCGAGTTLLNFTENGSSANWWTWICGLPPDFSSLSGCSASIRSSVSMTISDTGNNPLATAVYGQPLRLRPTVLSTYAGSASPPAPTGTVSFFDATGTDLEPLCSNVPLAGFCAKSGAAPIAGTRKLQAIYSGDTKFGRSGSALTQIAIQPATSTTSILSQTPNPVARGAPFTVAAQVNVNAPSLATATGWVEVLDLTDNLTCTYNLAGSTPGCAITPTSAGTHALRVAYLGDGSGNIAGSEATGSQTVTAPNLGLTINDGIAFARYGQTLHYTITLTNSGNGAATDVVLSGTPSPNFNGATVQWLCVAANGASCAAGGSGTTLSAAANLPASSSATWTANITVPADASGASVDFDVTAAGLPTVGDTDTLTLFRNGLE